MHALIDGDILVYRAGFAVQSKSKDIPKSHALHTTRSMLKKQIRYLKQYFKIDKVTIFITSDDKSNFRFEVAKTQGYKENRADMEKPIHYKAIRKYLVKKYKAKVAHGEEADDAIGKMSTQIGQNKCVIVSADKDLRQLPGWHWEMDEGRKPYFTDEEGFLMLERYKGRSQLFGTGLKFLYAQMLLGDRSDNIPGIPGYGDVKVFNELKDQSLASVEAKVAMVYEEAGVVDRYEEIYDLLWIRR